MTYERVSSEDQRERQTIRTQTETLARQLQQSPDVDLVGRYSDDGVSGVVPMQARPAGRQLLADAEHGVFDEVWVYDLTRLARNTAEATSVRDVLGDLGVSVCWDGRVIEPFLYDMHAALAAEERRRFLRRSMDGTNRAVVEGRYVGGIVPFGYRVDGYRANARLMPDDSVVDEEPPPVETVRHIFTWLAIDGWSCAQVAEELNRGGIAPAYKQAGRRVRDNETAGIWSSGRIRALVANTIYRGEFQYGKRSRVRRARVRAEAPRLVTDEIWFAAQTVLRRDGRTERRSQRSYLLSGLMRCGSCGSKYVGTTSRGETWYRCAGQLSRNRHGRCIGRSIKGQLIEPVVWADVQTWLESPLRLVVELGSPVLDRQEDVAEDTVDDSATALLHRLDERRRRRLMQHELGLIDIDELRSSLDELANERQVVEAQLARQPEPDRSALPPDEVVELRAQLAKDPADVIRQRLASRLVVRIAVNTQVDEAGRKCTSIEIEYRPASHDISIDVMPACLDSESRRICVHACPCGYYGDSLRNCTCPEASVSRYQRRVSGPMMDRIDLFTDVPRVDLQELAGEPSGERSETVRARVIEARERQAARLRGTRALTNAEMGPVEVRKFCQEAMAPEAQPLLQTAMQQLGLSARAFHRVLKVARTVADLAGSDTIQTVHLAESIQYRRRGAD